MNLFFSKTWREERRKTKQQKKFFGSFFSRGDLVYDVGANIGDRTDLFRKIGARVIAVEPQRACINSLNRRFAQATDVIILPKGLAAHEGTEKMAECVDITVLSTMSDKWLNDSRFATNERVRWKEKVDVDVTTLDKLISLYGTPRFCKIDVEGFEYQVLRGLSSKIPYISFEFMREFLDDVSDIIILLQNISEIEISFSLREKYDYEVLFENWGAPDKVVTKLWNFDDPKLWGDIYVHMV